MRASNNRRGIARQIVGENGVVHFISCCKAVSERVPLLWDSSKKNRRHEVEYWLKVW